MIKSMKYISLEVKGIVQGNESKWKSREQESVRFRSSGAE